MKIMLYGLLMMVALASRAQQPDSLSGGWRGSWHHSSLVRSDVKAEIVQFAEGQAQLCMYVETDTVRQTFLLQLRQQQDVWKIAEVQEVAPAGNSLASINWKGHFSVVREQNEICALEWVMPEKPVKQKKGGKNKTANLLPASILLLYPLPSDTAFREQAQRLMTAQRERVEEAGKRTVLASKEWTVKQEKITIYIWDNNKQDGDTISLKWNDTWILSHFLLKKAKYRIDLELEQGDNQLLMFAENLGSLPPNTASIAIDDNFYVRTFILNSNMTTSESVRIILQK